MKKIKLTKIINLMLNKKVNKYFKLNINYNTNILIYIFTTNIIIKQR